MEISVVLLVLQGALVPRTWALLLQDVEISTTQVNGVMDKSDLQRWQDGDMDTIDRYGFGEATTSEKVPTKQNFVTNGFEKVETKGGKVLEIAPLASPLFDTKYKEYYSVDVGTYEELLEKYKNDPSVNKAEIVRNTWKWQGERYSDLMANRKFDLIAAAHVIEHSPNLIDFLQNMDSVLEIGGELRLVIPDYRYCFDWARQPSTLAQIISADAEKRTRPSAENVLDHIVINHGNGHKNDPLLHWSRSPSQRAALVCHVPDAKFLEEARPEMDKAINGEYVDVHVWRFTPKLFTTYMEGLSKYGYLGGMQLVSVVPTQPNTAEFFATFRKQ